MLKYDRENHIKDLEYFMANQNELCNKHRGLVLLLQNGTVINAFNSLREASDKGKELFGYGNYSIQPCIEGEQAYSMKCYSPRIKFCGSHGTTFSFKTPPGNEIDFSAQLSQS